MKKSKFKRVLLKISGEALLGEREYGVDTVVSERIAREIKEAVDLKVEIAIVVGGGNIFRGYAASVNGMDRATADYMGMLATVMNSLALQDALEKQGVETRILSAINMQQVAEPYIRRRAIRHMEKGRVVVLAAGTGLPYFSTDTSAALRALEIDADVMLKATKVDGVYDRHPDEKGAKKYKQITYQKVLEKKLGILDAPALALCRDNDFPIIVFNLLEHNNIVKIIEGKTIGTLIKN